MSSEILINYEKLVADYLQSLATVLRGFNSALGYKFLETWVPDDNETVSILNILEAAHDAGLERISIHLGPATLGKLDLDRLAELVSRTGQVTQKNNGTGLDFGVTFSTGVGSAGSPASSRPLQSVRAVVTRELSPATTGPRLATGGGDTVNPLYIEALQRLQRRRLHVGCLQPSAGCVLAQSVQAGLTLMALVETTSHIVKQASFEGRASEYQIGLLEGLCGLMEGKPILECSDHVVIFLEFELRDQQHPRPVDGIITPENADSLFALATMLVRGTLADYRRQTGYQSIENNYDQPVSAQWRTLVASDRIQQIQSAIAQHWAGAGVRVMRLETPKRVVVAFTTALDGAAKQSCLLQLEGHLKRVLEPTLQLYVAPKVDENSIRRLKESPPR